MPVRYMQEKNNGEQLLSIVDYDSRVLLNRITLQVPFYRSRCRYLA